MLLASVRAVMERAVTPLHTRRDLGPVGQGTFTNPRFVQADDGIEYLLKSAGWCRQPNPYVCVNEWIAGLLARQCGLSVLEMTIVEHPAGLTVDWERIPQGMFASLATPGVLSSLRDSDDLYLLAVFDALIRNVDRNVRNILLRRVSRNTSEYRLIAHDHDQALIHPLVKPEDLWAVPALEDSHVWMRAEGIREALTNRTTLLTTADAVSESFSNTDVEEIVQSTPAAWLTEKEQKFVVDFLMQRLTTLRVIVSKHATNVLTRP